jgi:dTDP-4-dehydrorhamnose 3,5-epimerase
MENHWLLKHAKKDKQSITKEWQFLGPSRIDGVWLREVRNVAKDNGSLVEIVRSEWLEENKIIDQVFQVTLTPNGISAWHAHEVTTDRLFVTEGLIKIVLYDSREGSPTFGVINEFRLGSIRPGLLIIPPKVWHGVQNCASTDAKFLNLVDRAYSYEDPDHWRVPPDSPEIPHSFR